MYGGAKSNSRKTKTKKRNNSKKRGKLNLDKLATSTLLISSAVASLSKGQQKTLRKKIKQKRTKMKKKMKKRVKSGSDSTIGEGDGLVRYLDTKKNFQLFNPNAEDSTGGHAVLVEDTWTGPGDSNITIKDPEGHLHPLQWDSSSDSWLQAHFASPDAMF